MSLKKPFTVLLTKDLFELALATANQEFGTQMVKTYPQYGKDKIYLNFIDFHMILCVLKGHGVIEASEWPYDLFNNLSKHKKKLLFELLADEHSCILRLTKVLYNEKPDRMGLVIKKSVLREFYNFDYMVKFDDDFSKVVGKSFFYFP